MTDTLTTEIDGQGVATVTLNLPDSRNALSGAMIGELTEAAEHLGADPSIRAVVLRGAGKVFCAGGDLTWMKAQIAATRAERIAEATRLADMFGRLNEMPKPLIVRIHGGAFGGGVGLACVADVAVAAEGTTFGLTETKLGLIPATISPYVIARMGEGRARQVFMSSRTFDADEAVRLGIVARVVPEPELDDAVRAEVEPFLHVAPGAVAASKRLARELGPRIDAQVVAATILRLADTWEGDEAAHGIDAFLSRTKPRWA
ncbi:crotonase/enoyl-CoA hydratase family protein [Wenxinia marina]|uniref:Enoyl-CoA hydratase/carnithine racemase n=1 Tax=Wenxinia marina DSM 24838 TaxID=1123501 RepID=A0A0D0QJR7_9RHOB|nr:crotonase/enoyl-CoA hydratase family protein [Wenxinia marina]KIQ71248.1 Enoyl-CoA hydratase/carnithine racemase [Wenxinia marina DSM 24838]GGL73148.1 enoyl-CoA hydratase [Wenxinia marina]